MDIVNFEIGQTVYTANAKTKNVDKWTFSGLLPSGGEFLCHLTRGTKYVFLPRRCVFKSRKEAQKILN